MKGTYAIGLCERIAEYRQRWVEEPVPPDRTGDFAAIRCATNVPISTSEHEYTRWGFFQLLQADAIDVLHADPDWCGGISELTKICILASAFGKPVIPHGHSVRAAVHVIAATPPATCPMAEYLVCSQFTAQHVHTHQLHPDAGSISLPEAPGLGLEIDDSKVDRRTAL